MCDCLQNWSCSVEARSGTYADVPRLDVKETETADGLDEAPRRLAQVSRKAERSARVDLQSCVSFFRGERDRGLARVYCRSE